MDNKERRALRGELNDSFIEKYDDCSYGELLGLLDSLDARERSVSVRLLSEKYADEELLHLLVSHFSSENALYTRLELSSALVGFGELAVPYLVRLLGVVGDNHEDGLPFKFFNKKSYPLVRDLSGRTLVKIGGVCIPYLIDLLASDVDLFVKWQAVDVVGGIVSQGGVGEDDIVSLVALFRGLMDVDVLSRWRVVRAFSGFKGSDFVFNLVYGVLISDKHVPVLWECIRSLCFIDAESVLWDDIVLRFGGCDDHNIRLALDFRDRFL